MDNALSSPPAPNPDLQTPQTGNALSSPMGAAAGPGMPNPPPPSHAQTVAALRHFHAIEQALTRLLKNPETGKSDMRSDVIDEVTKLVSQGYMPAAEAVQQLGTLPTRPFDQKKWLEQHLVEVILSADFVLAHHGAAYAGQNVQGSIPSMDAHAGIMSGLRANYMGTAGNG